MGSDTIILIVSDPIYSFIPYCDTAAIVCEVVLLCPTAQTALFHTLNLRQRQRLLTGTVWAQAVDLGFARSLRIAATLQPFKFANAF